VYSHHSTPQDFRQEGWRLEHETTGDASTPIIIKGVVYNEMKGALSPSDALYWVKARCCCC
jgi:Zn-dependent M16 (insulinase) family peptidase